MTTEEPTYGDARDRILARAKSAKMTYLHGNPNGIEGRDPQLILIYPDGQVSRSVIIDRESAQQFEELPFEKYLIVGQYRSLFDPVEQTLEAAVIDDNGRSMLMRRLTLLPGVETIEEPPPTTEFVYDVEGELFEAEIPETETSSRRYTDWRLPLPGAPATFQVELSPVSKKMYSFMGPHRGPQASLKISGVTITDREKLLNLLETVSSSVFFEIDVRFHRRISLELRQDSRFAATRRLDTGSEPVRFPKIKYPKAATTLYSYGRAAFGTPLMQFLGFYQAIEHFFPTFVNQDAIVRVRNALRHPSFNRESDADVHKLISQAGRLGGKGPDEGEQLRTTLLHSVEREDIVDWLDAVRPDLKEALTGSQKLLAGVSQLSLKPDHNRKLVDQVADRIYTLRNRIVHAKESNKYLEPLLPYSHEATLLQPDIHLIEFLAQKVIIAGSHETF